MSVSIDAQIAKTIEATLSYATEFHLFVDPGPFKQRAHAEVIATFACLCAPAAPSPAGTILAAQLLSLLLYLDDLPKDQLASCEREMLEVLHAPQASPTRPQAQALRDYLRQLEEYGDTARFREQFEDCLIAARDEALLAETPLTVTAYKSIRRRVIGVEEYLWTWLLSERMPFDSAAFERTVRVRQLASDVVYLVNDLGSLDRDRAPGGAPNLVTVLQREQGLSEPQAIEAVIRLHDETATAYRAEASGIRALGATPAALAITGVVEFVVRGNLATTKKLSGCRYPGAEARLSRLLDY